MDFFRASKHGEYDSIKATCRTHRMRYHLTRARKTHIVPGLSPCNSEGGRWVCAFLGEAVHYQRISCIVLKIISTCRASAKPDDRS